MLLSISCFLAFLDLVSASKTNATVAKVYPGTKSYPSQAAWNKLSTATGGRLQKCPMMGPNQEYCGDPQLLSDYVLFAKSAADISAGLKFATEHNLRVTVRNTGHDFMTRHSARGAFTIVTTNLKGTVYMNPWTPTAGSKEFIDQQVAKKQTAAVVNAGNTFIDALNALNPHGQSIVHGADPTVGAAGGWHMGGGHGPYSNRYGMGCDNVLEFEVVLTNGTIVTANEGSYPDLFWALRGGGGSTYAITTKTTTKTFKSPVMPNIAIHITIGNTGRDGWLDALAYFFAMSPNMTDFGLSGYPVISNSTYLASLTAPGRTALEVSMFFNPIAARMRSYGANVQVTPGLNTLGWLSPVLGVFIGASRVPDVLGQLHDQQNAWRKSRKQRRQNVDFRPYYQTPLGSMASRLLARSQLNEANIPAIRTMLGNLKGYLLPYPNVGGAVAANRNLSVGLNPAWRDAAMHLIAVSYDRAANIKAMDPLSVNHAAYVNEGYEFEDDWKTSFFGPPAHYGKLLAVKKKYDPTNTLWCYPCVGSDVFVERRGRLYMSNGDGSPVVRRPDDESEEDI